MKQITDKSIYLWVLKWLPVIGTALIASHYAMLPFGYKSYIIDYITDVSLFAWIYLYFASKLFFSSYTEPSASISVSHLLT